MNRFTTIRLSCLIFLGILFCGCSELNESFFIYEAYQKKECASILPFSEEFIEANKDNPQFWYFRGLCNLQSENYEQAKRDFIHSNNLNYRYSRLTEFGLSISNFNLGNSKEAFEHLQSSLDNGLPYHELDNRFLSPFTNSQEFQEFKAANEPSFDLSTSFLLLLALHGIIFAVYIMLKGKNNEHNVFLGLLLILYCVIICSFSLYLSKWRYFFPYLNDSWHALIYGLGPLFYFYLRSALFGKGSLTRDLLHFLPVAVIAYFIFLYRSNIIGYPTYYLAVNPYFKVAHLIAYGVLAYVVYKRKKSQLKKTVVNWFRLVFAFYVLFFISLFGNALYLEFYSYGKMMDLMFAFGTSMFVLLCVLTGYISPQVLWGSSLERAIKSIKYGKSGLSRKVSLELKKLLLDKIQNDKLYLKSDLSLNDLSEILLISSKHVSQVINENFNVGFYDFINRFRIEEAKKLLTKESAMKVEEVAYKVGFNNKASFYSSFKKFEKTTPKHYLSSLFQADAEQEY